MTVVPVPKKAKVTCLSDYRPVARTSVAMKSFDRLVMAHINTIMPETLDSNSHTASTDDIITLHSALTHLDKRINYLRMCSLTTAQCSTPYQTKGQHTLTDL